MWMPPPSLVAASHGPPHLSCRVLLRGGWIAAGNGLLSIGKGTHLAIWHTASISSYHTTLSHTSNCINKHRLNYASCRPLLLQCPRCCPVAPSYLQHEEDLLVHIRGPVIFTKGARPANDQGASQSCLCVTGGVHSGPVHPQLCGGATRAGASRGRHLPPAQGRAGGVRGCIEVTKPQWRQGVPGSSVPRPGHILIYGWVDASAAHKPMLADCRVLLKVMHRTCKTRLS